MNKVYDGLPQKYKLIFKNKVKKTNKNVEIIKK